MIYKQLFEQKMEIHKQCDSHEISASLPVYQKTIFPIYENNDQSATEWTMQNRNQC